MKLTDEQIEKAANWWAEAIGAPKFQTLSQEERKDRRNDGVKFAEVMARMLVKEVTPEQAGVFKNELRKALLGDDIFWNIGTDYHPDRILAGAAEKAGIPDTNFPWKTNMNFYDDGSVKVSCGYGEPYKTL